ncbi:MAG: tetratricopeptide repeat protein [Phycisphaerales bacterium]|nr:tetratricopeptide repeat protein [Phycisphaerales bacterium]
MKRRLKPQPAADALPALPSRPLPEPTLHAPQSPPPRVVIGLAVACCFLLLISFQWSEIYSTDLGWQLRAGQWMVQNAAIPYTDKLAFTTQPPFEPEPRTWIEARWLFCIAQYFAWMAGGSAGVIFMATLIVAAALALLLSAAPRTLATPIGPLILALGIWAGASRWLPRPEVATYLMIVVYLFILERRTRWIIALPLLQILWTNTHGLFILGPALAWLYAAHAALCGAVAQGASPVSQRIAADSRPAARTWLIVAGLTTAACFLNPYGLSGVLFPFLLYSEIQGGHRFSQTIGEFVSPLTKSLDQWTPDMLAAPLMIALGVVLGAAPLRLSTLPRLAFVLATAFLATLAQRNVTLAVVAALWAALRGCEEWLSSRQARRSAGRPQAPLGRTETPDARPRSRNTVRTAGFVGVALASLIGAWFVASGRFAATSELNMRAGLALTPWMHGQDAIEFIRTAQPRGHVYHHMREGGWMAWRGGPEYPVFIDGRLEVYGTGGVMEDYLGMTIRNFPAVFEKYGIHTAIVDLDRTRWLSDALRQSGQWTLVHVDPLKAVYIRNIPEHEELISRWRIDPLKAFEPRGPEPDDRPTAWRRALGDRTPPRYALGMALAFLHLGGIDNAERYLQRAVDAVPWHGQSRVTLARIRRVQGRIAEAEELERGIAVTPQRRAQLDTMQAGLLMDSGRHAEAIPLLRNSIAAAPRDPLLYKLLADCYLLTKDLKAAEQTYLVTTGLTPRDMTVWANLGYVREARGDWAGAAAAYTTAVQLAPRDPRVHNQLGISLAQAGNREQAAAAFRAALQLDPGYEKARQNLSQLEQAVAQPAAPPGQPGSPGP